MTAWVTPAVAAALLHGAIRIGAIVLGAAVVLRLALMFIDRLFMPHPGSKKLLFEEKRAKTLGVLIKTVVRYTIYFIAGLMVLQEFRIDTTSLLAGAGVVGLALGVGAQNLVKDVIAGFFIIFEDQYAVGEYVALDELTGTIEEIGFRVTKLRDFYGVLHTIPNGTIRKVGNYNRGYTQAVVDVPLPYAANLEQVLALLEEVCQEVYTHHDDLLEKPVVVGVTALKPGVVVVRVIAKTVPLAHWGLETYLRQCIKDKLTAANVPPPPAIPGA